MASITKALKCPKCEHANAAKVWDEWTKKEVGIEESEPYLSIEDDMDEVIEEMAFFKCPVCNAEVPGVRLLVHNDLMEEDDIPEGYYDEEE